jgi:hypothetical protein
VECDGRRFRGGGPLCWPVLVGRVGGAWAEIGWSAPRSIPRSIIESWLWWWCHTSLSRGDFVPTKGFGWVLV